MPRKKAAAPPPERLTANKLIPGTFIGRDGEFYIPVSFKMRLDLQKQVELIKADPGKPDLKTTNGIYNRAMALGLRAIQLGVADFELEPDNEEVAADG